MTLLTSALRNGKVFFCARRGGLGLALGGLPTAVIFAAPLPLFSKTSARPLRSAAGCTPARTITPRIFAYSTHAPSSASTRDNSAGRRSPFHSSKLFAYKFLVSPRSPCAASTLGSPRCPGLISNSRPRFSAFHAGFDGTYGSTPCSCARSISSFRRPINVVPLSLRCAVPLAAASVHLSSPRRSPRCSLPLPQSRGSANPSPTVHSPPD